MHPVSPLAPKAYPSLPPIAGVRLAASECHIRYPNRKDVLLAELAPGTTVAGVFTRSLTASAPVLAGKENVAKGLARLLVVNSGNSNAFTGKAGVDSVKRVELEACKLFDAKPHEFFMASTGVIGEKLPDEKITAALPTLKNALQAGAWDSAARAIMTTDTFPKMVTRTAEIGGAKVTLNGIAKGSGMIAPDMATMLGFLFTDAAIAPPVLQKLVTQHVATTFNAITVDGDTSTSDTLLLFATGEAESRGAPRIEAESDQRLADFSRALHEVMHELALAIIKDGEGISKLITVQVEGAESDAAAKRIALSIANSPLVKTAIAGSDANWGRVVAAIGKAGEAADRDRLAIWFGDVQVARDGMRASDYSEEAASAHVRGREIIIRTDVGTGGPGRATVWGCDLTNEYIAINADYRS
jgi:glutamate N-acetyltransferase/amino-acid N-acetyltransferase